MATEKVAQPRSISAHTQQQSLLFTSRWMLFKLSDYKTEWFFFFFLHLETLQTNFLKSSSKKRSDPPSLSDSLRMAWRTRFLAYWFTGYLTELNFRGRAAKLGKDAAGNLYQCSLRRTPPPQTEMLSETSGRPTSTEYRTRNLPNTSNMHYHWANTTRFKLSRALHAAVYRRSVTSLDIIKPSSVGRPCCPICWTTIQCSLRTLIIKLIHLLHCFLRELTDGHANPHLRIAL